MQPHVTCPGGGPFAGGFERGGRLAPSLASGCQRAVIGLRFVASWKAVESCEVSLLMRVCLGLLPPTRACLVGLYPALCGTPVLVCASVSLVPWSVFAGVLLPIWEPLPGTFI